jgi:hypothetical protein
VRIEDDPPSRACFAVRPGGDFDILVECRQHSHQPRDRISPVVATQDVREVGLLDTEQLGRVDLRQFSFLYQAAQLNDQRGFQLMLVGIGEAEVGKDVAVADVVRRQSFLAHRAIVISL